MRGKKVVDNYFNGAKIQNILILNLSKILKL